MSCAVKAKLSLKSLRAQSSTGVDGTLPRYSIEYTDVGLGKFCSTPTAAQALNPILTALYIFLVRFA